MLDEDFIKITEINAEVSEEGNLHFDKSELKKIYNSGFRNLKIIIMGKPDEGLDSLNINKVLFKQIKETQKLPDAVVIDFIASKGKVNKDKFKQ